MYPDRAKITRITRDASYRTETEVSPFYSDCYAEEESRIVYDKNGEPVTPLVKISLPVTTRNLAIEKGDYVQLTKLHGRIPTGQDAFQRKTRQVSLVGGSEASHIEVVI